MLPISGIHKMWEDLYIQVFINVSLHTSTAQVVGICVFEIHSWIFYKVRIDHVHNNVHVYVLYSKESEEYNCIYKGQICSNCICIYNTNEDTHNIKQLLMFNTYTI